MYYSFSFSSSETDFVCLFVDILKRIFGPKRDENGEWRMLHNEELHSLWNWVDSAQDMNYWRALVNAALNLRVP